MTKDRYFRKKVLLLLMSLLLITVSCVRTGLPLRNINSLPEGVSMESSPKAGEYPEDDGVVLYERQKVNVYLNPHGFVAKEEFRRVIKVFRNVDRFSEVNMYLNGSVLDRISARTIKPDGTVINLSREDIFIVVGESSRNIFYDDSVIMKFNFPSLEKGSIIEYSFTRHSRNPFIMDRWNIEGEFPKLYSRYDVSFPKFLVESEKSGGAGLKWKYKTYNTAKLQSEIKKSKESQGEYIASSFTVKDVPAFKFESRMTPPSQHIAHLVYTLSDWESWNDVSKNYYNNYFVPQLVTTEDVKKKAVELTKNSKRELDKISSLYKFTQKMHYVAVNQGVRRIMPSKPDKILKRGYGDCKDKSMLLLSMLLSQNIKAEPVLILTSDQGLIDPGYPGLNFNHMIVKVTTSDEKELWLDPTVRFAPLSMIPSGDADVNALVLHSDGTSTLELTPSASYKDNLMALNATIKLAPEGTSGIDVNVKFQGEMAVVFKNLFYDQSTKDIEEVIRSFVSDGYFDSKIERIEFTSPDTLSSDFEFSFSIVGGEFLEKLGADIFLVSHDPFTSDPAGSLYWLAETERVFPILWRMPYSMDKSVVIDYSAAELAIGNMPEKIEFSMPGDSLTYSSDYKEENPGVIHYSEKYAQKTTVISKEKYSDLRKFFKKIKTGRDGKIILKKEILPSSP